MGKQTNTNTAMQMNRCFILPILLFCSVLSVIRLESNAVKLKLLMSFRYITVFSSCYFPQIFQPLLMEYFTYDELKAIKSDVIQRHLRLTKYKCDSEKDDSGVEVKGKLCSKTQLIKSIE